MVLTIWSDLCDSYGGGGGSVLESGIALTDD